ncbi:MAG TPA: urease accessory UreF family protein [Verrucomicrobiae bacterium]|nr:urease accessory UreF family protein [Verrucomicrobiae bacterium]
MADSAFPTGGFAHSGGLEAAWQQGELANPGELASFIRASLCQLGRASLPFVTAAHANPGNWLELDRLCDTFNTNHVANRASRLQGQALLASAERIFATHQLEQLRQSARQTGAFYHFAPVFGVTTNALGIDFMPAARLFFFIHLRGLVTGAIRLGIIGPLEGQALLHSFAAQAEEVLLRCRNLTREQIAQPSPLLELFQANQDRLYSRLFQS